MSNADANYFRTFWRGNSFSGVGPEILFDKYLQNLRNFFAGIVMMYVSAKMDCF